MVQGRNARALIYGLTAIALLIGLWFIEASLIFVKLGQLDGQLEHPWLAYWTYFAEDDQETRIFIIIAGVLAFFLTGATMMLVYRVISFGQQRRWLRRWPWEGDNQSRPTEEA